MASERTNEAGGFCWLRVRLRKGEGEDELYFCRECGPEALRERIGGPGPNIGMYPNDTPADAVCARCGYGLKGEVPVLEAVPVGRGERRRWRVWCVYCEGYHHHAPEAGYRRAHCGGNPSSPYRETGYFLRLKVARNGR